MESNKRPGGAFCGSWEGVERRICLTSNSVISDSLNSVHCRVVALVLTLTSLLVMCRQQKASPQFLHVIRDRRINDLQSRPQVDRMRRLGSHRLVLVFQ